MKWNDIGEQTCSIARSLAILGDRWTMLLLRNAFLGTRRFDDFQQQLGVTRHVLADRLKRLVDVGVLRKEAYQANRQEYRLTEMGRDLYPVVISLATWGDKWLDEGKGAPLLYRHRGCGHTMHPVLTCPDCGEPVQARDVIPEIGPGMDTHQPAPGKARR